MTSRIHWGGLNTNGIRTVVETFVSEDKTQWYRVWSDGWIEQGGNLLAEHFVIAASGTIVTFLKPFTNTNYILVLGGGNQDNSSNNVAVPYGNSYYGSIYKPDKKPESFRVVVSGSWYACGY